MMQLGTMIRRVSYLAEKRLQVLLVMHWVRTRFHVPVSGNTVSTAGLLMCPSHVHNFYA